MNKLAYIGAALMLPALAFAQVDSIQDAGAFLIDLINNVAVPVVFALAFIVFIWGVFTYFILGGSNEDKRKEGTNLMLWGLIGFFVMVSVWGLVNILTGTLNLSDTPPPLPSTPTSY